jgi:hypothetical protein
MHSKRVAMAVGASISMFLGVVGGSVTAVAKTASCRVTWAKTDVVVSSLKVKHCSNGATVLVAGGSSRPVFGLPTKYAAVKPLDVALYTLKEGEGSALLYWPTGKVELVCQGSGCGVVLVKVGCDEDELFSCDAKGRRYIDLKE